MVRAYWDAGVRHIVALRGDPVGGIGTRLRAASGRLRADLRSRRRHQAGRRFRGLGVGLSREASGSRLARGRHRRAEGQGRCRRRPRHHAVLLRQRLYSPLPRPRARARHRHSRSCPASCRCRTSSRRRISPRGPAPRIPDWLAPRFEGLDEDVETRKLIAAAVAAEQVHRPRRPRRHRAPLLHHEPRRPRLRRSATCSASGRSRSRTRRAAA